MNESNVAGAYICFDIIEIAAITNLSKAKQFINTHEIYGLPVLVG